MQAANNVTTFLKRCIVAVVGLTPCIAGAHGAYHDVVNELSALLKQHPEDAAAHFKLACAHQEHRDWSLALVELEQVERLAPGKFETGYVQGQALATGGHILAARPVLDDFIATHPGHAGALAVRARVLLELKETAAALHDFNAG